MIFEQLEDRRLLATAVDDQYTIYNSRGSVYANNILTTSALGVMANDDFHSWYDEQGHYTYPYGEFTSSPSHGSLQLYADIFGLNFRYTPDAGFVGTDLFTYRIWDEPGWSYDDSDGDPDPSSWHNLGPGNWSEATVTIDVMQGPTVLDDYYQSNPETGTLTGAATLLDNDVIPDTGHWYAGASSMPGHGTLDMYADGRFGYSPNPGFTGYDHFTYSVTNLVAFATSSVWILVSSDGEELPPIPTCNSDQYETEPDTELSVAAANGVLANDDEAVDAQAVIVSRPTHGSLTLNGDGSFVYVPTSGYSGDDEFSYCAELNGRPSNTATVAIQVASSGQSVHAATDDYSMAHGATLNVAVEDGVLANDTRPDDGELIASLVSGPAHGSLSLDTDGSFVYTPNSSYEGTDSFVYQASNGFVTSRAMAIIAVGHPPAAYDGSFDGVQDTSQFIPSDSLIADDGDYDSLTKTITGGPLHGTLTATSGGWTYTPAAGFYGTDRFSFKANDEYANSNTATVTIHVYKRNWAPVAADDNYNAFHNRPLVVNAPGVLGNDYDPDTDPFTLIAVAGISSGTIGAEVSTDHGTVILRADGSVEGNAAAVWLQRNFGAYLRANADARLTRLSDERVQGSV